MSKDYIQFNTLKRTIESWKETNYPDFPSQLGYMKTLERLYKGRYDLEAAEYLIELTFKNYKMKEL